ncbi:MAG: formate--tetrahydrofolate ligase [Bacillota bacterium]
MHSDIEIARNAALKNITEIALNLGLHENDYETYGRYKTKISPLVLSHTSARANGKLILVTALNPTPAGEGKTTITIALGDGLNKLGYKAAVALREPSLGPTFGKKGGATGGGYSQVAPMEDINLHFTGDLHAVTTANNLLAAILDNHIYHGNRLGIDLGAITWRRCMDVNDRQLRNIMSGLGGKTCGVSRQDGFDITAASEIMAVLCLSANRADLKHRLSRIIVAYNTDGEPVTVKDLHAQGALAALLKDAFKPNLVQSLEHTPVLMHGGPFANIAHGCSSIIATRMGLKLSEYLVTEAGFGADLGAEKFLNIKCRQHGIWPHAAVVVVTARALKYHGGAQNGDGALPDIEALKRGLPNLTRHLQNLTGVFGLPAVVAINTFLTDIPEEIDCIIEHCKALGVTAVPTDAWAQGGNGAVELARAVTEAAEGANTSPRFLYDDAMPLSEKVRTIVQRIYGGRDITLDAQAREDFLRIDALGFAHLPVCMAKTPMSLSDDPKLLGCPQGFSVRVRRARLSAGAGFVVVYTGSVITMPGLPPMPASERIDIDDHGIIHGIS